MKKYSSFVCVLSIFVSILFLAPSSLFAQTLTRQEQLASISSQLHTLAVFFENLKASLAPKPSHAQTTAPAPATFVTPSDKIPNFAQAPTITSARAGNWGDANTWSPARVPGADDIVLIKHTINYGSTEGVAHTIGIDAEGKLVWRTDQNTKLSVGTLQVLPNGILEIGTQSNPILTQFTAEIVIRNIPLDITNDGIGVFDPFQFGTGILAFDGTVTMHGAVKTPTWLRVGREPRAGDTTLTLESAPSGWKAGDKLILPDTRQLMSTDVGKVAGREGRVRLNPQWEELTIQSISGATITLASPLRFNHLGARDLEGHLDFLPHVGNLSRNITIRSENPAGTRGHILFTRRPDVSIRYAEFDNLGRTKAESAINSTVLNPDGTVNTVGTNQIGRYALHAHHLIGPQVPPANGYQFTFEGNALSDAEKWGIAIHGSHYGLVRDNVVYDAVGAGIVTEDGSETKNVIERNFTVRNEGSGLGVEGRGRIQAQLGHEGSGFWFRGANNYVRDNVSANSRVSGFMFFQLLGGRANTPLFQGSDPHAGSAVVLEVQTMPLLEFTRNEGYGSNKTAFEVWQNSGNNVEAGQLIRMSNLDAWHNPGGTFVIFYTAGAVIDNVKIRGDVNAIEGTLSTAPVVSPRDNHSVGIEGHLGVAWRIRNADIQGLRIGLQGGIRGHLLEDSFLRNEENVRIHLAAAGRLTSGTINMTPQAIILRNVRFQALPNKPLRTINAAQFSTYLGLESSIAKREIFVENYNGQPGRNFQIFFKEQRPDFVVKTGQNRPPEPRKPDGLQEGITNQENFDQFGLTLLSAFPSCFDETSYPEIVGYVCGVGADTQPPVIIERLPVSVTPTTATFMWTTNEVSTGMVEYWRGQRSTSLKLEDAALQPRHTVTLTGLLPATAYSYILSGTDAVGNPYTTTTRSPFWLNFTTATVGTTPPPSPDSVRPTIPTNLTATPISSSRINLAWNPSTDNVGVTAYRIFRNNTLLTTVIGTTYAYLNTGLSPDTTYFYQIMALDAVGNNSDRSASVSAVTPESGITLPPPPPASDTIVPTVSLTAPLANTTVAGTVTILATATDTGGISRVEFLVDEVVKSTDTTAPYSYAWDTTNGGTHPCNGPHTHTLRARAYDSNNNPGVSSTVTVNMANPGYCTTIPPPPASDGVFRQYNPYAVWSSCVTGACTGVRLRWDTNRPATHQVAYGLTPSLGSLTTRTATLATRPIIDIANLAPNTVYYFAMRSWDADGTLVTSPTIKFSTRPRENLPSPTPLPDTTAPELYNVWVYGSGADPTRFTVMWNANELVTSELAYGTTEALGRVVRPIRPLGHSHFELGGLLPDTYYYFVGKSRDASGNLSEMPMLVFKTPSSATPPPPPATDATPPVLEDVHEHDIAPTAATIFWTTDEAATSMIQYGLTASLGSETAEVTALSYTHNVSLSNLAPSTAYFYRARSRDAAGNTSMSAIQSFKTPTEDNIPPPSNARVTLTEPTPNQILSGPDVAVRYQKINATGAEHLHLQLDSQPEVRDTNFTGSYTFSSVAPGTHTISGYLGDNIAHAKISGTEVSVTFTVRNQSVALSVGDRIWVAENVNVRSAASTGGRILGTQYPGAQGSIVGGPVTANEYVWWNINYDTGVDGWSIQNPLRSVPGSTAQNQWINKGGRFNPSGGWFDWVRNDVDGRYCARGYNGDIQCYDAANNRLETVYDYPGTATVRPEPRSGDLQVFVWNHVTKEYINMDGGRSVGVTPWAFSMVTRTWRALTNADFAGIESRRRASGAGSATSPDHDLILVHADTGQDQNAALWAL